MLVKSVVGSRLVLFMTAMSTTYAQDVYQLERGDIITVVNGEKIVNVNQYQRLCDLEFQNRVFYT